MNCLNCGYKHDGQSNFCQNCGVPIQNNNIKKSIEKRKKNKSIFFIIPIFSLILLGSFFLLRKDMKSPDKSEEGNQNEVEMVVFAETSYDKIKKDFEEGNISSDKYIEQLLYLRFDQDLLDTKYESENERFVSIHVIEELEKYYEELSEKTINYFLEQLFLSDITFKLDIENDDENEDFSILNYLIPQVKAEEDTKTTNLNKVVLSSNNNFIVWYTTTGKNAATEETASKIGEGLENAIFKYKEEFGCDYYFETTVIGDFSDFLINTFTFSNRVKDQSIILENNGISKEHLNTAMQVYLVSDESALAFYVNIFENKFKQFLSKFIIKDMNDVMIMPYMVITPEAIIDYETLTQTYNHELFHHFQSHILCGHPFCEKKITF